LRLTKLLPQPYNKIGVVCIAISAVRFVGAFYLTVIAVISPNLADYRHKVSWLFLATFSVSAAVDVAIASSMLYYLAQKRRREMHRWVHHKLDIAVLTSRNSNEFLEQNV
jgi:hypothetical protein